MIVYARMIGRYMVSWMAVLNLLSTFVCAPPPLSVELAAEKEYFLKKLNFPEQENVNVTDDVQNGGETVVEVERFIDVENKDSFEPIKLPRRFIDYDLNGDMFIDVDELIAVSGAVENVDIAFKASDKDGDGKISEAEFYGGPLNFDVEITDEENKNEEDTLEDNNTGSLPTDNNLNYALPSDSDETYNDEYDDSTLKDNDDDNDDDDDDEEEEEDEEVDETDDTDNENDYGNDGIDNDHNDKMAEIDDKYENENEEIKEIDNDQNDNDNDLNEGENRKENIDTMNSDNQNNHDDVGVGITAESTEINKDLHLDDIGLNEERNDDNLKNDDTAYNDDSKKDAMNLL